MFFSYKKLLQWSRSGLYFEFYQLLSELFASGLSLKQSLFLLKECRLNRFGVIDKLSDRMSESSSITDIFNGLIPSEDLMYFDLLTVSKDPCGVMRSLIDNKINNKNMINKFTGALVPPLILLLMCYGLVVAYSVYIFPIFEEIIPLRKWPLISRYYYDSGRFLFSGEFFVIFGIFCIGCTALFYWLINGYGKVRVLFNYLPIVKEVNLYYSAMFFRNYYLYSCNGFDTKFAVNKMRDGAKGYYKGCLHEIVSNFDLGNDVRSQIDVGLLSEYELNKFALFFSMNDFKNYLERSYKDTDKRLLIRVDRLSKIINVLLLVLVGLTIVFAYFSVNLLVSVI
ncbi:hypothetical protein [Vibrio splendidus]|uniref:hypothetical protein n=1 Tax=Vibrio splendidus TaxID=29497 RepID=UPI0021B1A93B|nr:hypothetical protein [Vibrio splendidus]UWZ98596.1 hypothetical protein IM698_04365 [Vibrio splendidus]